MSTCYFSITLNQGETKMLKRIFHHFIIILCAALSALNYKVFVFPNVFAPAGVDGICTMIQYLTNTSMGYLSLIANIPLIIIALFILKRDFVEKSAVYTVSFSIAVVLLQAADFIPVYHTDTGTSIVLAPIAAGTIRGILYAVTLKFGGSSGGTDLVAAMVQKKKPYMNLMSIIFMLNVIIACSAFFVYNYRFEPVICSIIYSFITSLVTKHLEATRKESVRFEIITGNPSELCQSIKTELKSTATVVDAYGTYSSKNTKLVICVISKELVPNLENILKRFDDAVVFESIINNSFKHKTKSKQEVL